MPLLLLAIVGCAQVARDAERTPPREDTALTSPAPTAAPVATEVPTLVLDATSASARIEPAEIKRVVRSKLGRYRRCWERFLRMNPPAFARVDTEFVVGPRGDVVAATSRNDDAPEGVTACVVAEIRTLRFPAPRTGSVTVHYPIVLSSWN